MMDILSKIDDAVEQRCACGCGRDITPNGPSMWYATPECQQSYLERETMNPAQVYLRPDATDVWPGSDGARWTQPSERPEESAYERIQWISDQFEREMPYGWGNAAVTLDNSDARYTVHWSRAIPLGHVAVIDEARYQETLRRVLENATFGFTAEPMHFDEDRLAFRANLRYSPVTVRFSTDVSDFNRRIRRMHHAYRVRQLARRRRNR